MRPSGASGHWMVNHCTGHLPLPFSPRSKSPKTLWTLIVNDRFKAALPLAQLEVFKACIHAHAAHAATGILWCVQCYCGVPFRHVGLRAVARDTYTSKRHCKLHAWRRCVQFRALAQGKKVTQQRARKYTMSGVSSTCYWKPCGLIHVAWMMRQGKQKTGIAPAPP